MYKKANFLQKIGFCLIFTLFSFVLFFTVSETTNLECNSVGNCQIYKSNLLSKTSSHKKTLDISSLRSMNCKYAGNDKYQIRYNTRNGSGYFGKFDKFDCETITSKLMTASSQIDKTINHKIHTADFLQRFIAKAFGFFLIFLAILSLLGKVEIATEPPNRNSKLPNEFPDELIDKL